MPERPARPNGFDDPTRDIRLPPPPVVPDPGPPTRAERLASEPTDEFFPHGRPLRDPTLKLERGDGAPAPVVPPVHPPARAPDDERGRRWPWVLLALLPIVVIVGSGIWLFILLSHG